MYVIYRSRSVNTDECVRVESRLIQFGAHLDCTSDCCDRWLLYYYCYCYYYCHYWYCYYCFIFTDPAPSRNATLLFHSLIIDGYAVQKIIKELRQLAPRELFKFDQQMTSFLTNQRRAICQTSSHSAIESIWS